MDLLAAYTSTLTGTPHQLLLLEGQNPTISDAKLVLFTSHHVIVKTQSKISVFQTSGIPSFRERRDF
ncbi:MAG TPA: hypothetical protein VKJ65_09195, partial [Phycisphaerae bacterium]|nr:hypothetical protein [Phycisphaerae bacterium]